MLKIIVIMFILNVNTNVINSARILAMLPTPSFSHNIVYHPVLRELSLRGHQVVSIIPDLINDPKLVNLTEIDVSFSYEIWHRFNKFTKERLEGYSPIQSMYGMSQGLLELCDRELDMPEVKKIIQDPDEHFDLVINEWLLFPSTFAFGTRFNCPIVGISSFGLNPHGHDSIGNPTHPVYNPDFYLSYSHNLTFWQRTYSVIYSVWYRFYFHFKLLPQHDAIAKKHFGADLPYLLDDAMKRITIVLVSENPVYTGAKPTVPAFIDISGLHFKPIHPLPEDLQKMLDNAKQGVIYFSLGTNVKSKNLPKEKFQALIESFRDMPYLVLWKFELNEMKGKPDNVIIRKWFPQQDLLAHPNVKLFLMQGGLQSAEESINRRVPMIAIPFFADQEINAARFIYHGIGDRLGFEELDKPTITRKILNIITDQRYYDRINQLADLMWDTPISSLDRAVWWIEFVLRHKGLPKLRSPTADLPWIQILMLDVIGFFLFCALILIIVLYYFIRVVRKIFSKNAEKLKKN